MIANTLDILSSSRVKKDKNTSKSPLSLQTTTVPNHKRTKLSAFSQLLGEAKESKKTKTSSKSPTPDIKISVRKQNETPSTLTPIISPAMASKQEDTPILQSQKNTKKSTRISRPARMSTTQSTQEQLSLQKQDKTPIKTKKRIQPPLNEMLAQTRKPKTQKETKTLADITKITQEHQLNLTKLEIKSQEDKERPLQKTVSRDKRENQRSQLETLMNVQNKSKSHTQKNDQSTKIQDSRERRYAQFQLKDQTPSQPVEQNHTQGDTQERVGREFSLTDLLKVNPKEKNLENKEEGKLDEKPKEIKTQDLALSELKRDVQLKIASSRETLSQFSQRIREEVLNYKPPFTKLSMELNPAELGKLEITITKKGKELIVNVNANNPNALHTFMQNQNEFRTTLSNVGFNNVELNFSQSDGGEKNPQQEEKNQKRNKNGLEETITEIPALASMEIKMVQYA